MSVLNTLHYLSEVMQSDKHYLLVYIGAYQQFEMLPIFSFVMYSSDRLSPFPSYYSSVIWKLLAPYVQKKALI